MLSRLLSIGILSLVTLVAGAADQGSAPGPGPRGHGPNRADYLDKVTILLDLNAGQKVQLQQILDEQHEQMRTQMQALREQAQSSGKRPDFEQMQQQRTQAEKDLVDKLRPVLSDVQLKKFEALRELTGPRPGGRGPGHGPRPDRH
jgi:Spy/CpxP family protein refolding chaperone